MSTVGGINTVLVDGKYIHITDLSQQQLCEAWSKQQRELKELYRINADANQGWRGFILSLLGIYLPDRKVINLGGVDSKNQSIYETD